METTFIYVLIDPRTEAVRYVGKSDSPFVRWQNHISSAPARLTHCQRWLFKLAESGHSPTLKVIEEVERSIWAERERYWIQHYQECGEPLTNICRGGRGGLGLRHTEASKIRISNRFRGIPLSNEHRRKLSDARKKKFENPEARAVLSRHFARLTDEQVREIRRLAVDGTLTQDEIASQFGIKPGTVQSIRAGKSYRHVFAGVEPDVLIDPRHSRSIPRRDAIIALRRSGATYREIADRIGVCIDYIAVLMAKAKADGITDDIPKGKVARPISEQTRKSLSESHKGKQQSEETKQKRGESLRRYHAKRRHDPED